MQMNSAEENSGRLGNDGKAFPSESFGGGEGSIQCDLISDNFPQMVWIYAERLTEIKCLPTREMILFLTIRVKREKMGSWNIHSTRSK